MSISIDSLLTSRNFPVEPPVANGGISTPPVAVVLRCIVSRKGSTSQ